MSTRHGSAQTGFQSGLGSGLGPRPETRESGLDLQPIPNLSIPLHNALEEATRCIQCGFCLPACPTYKVFGQEKHSPRGRIQLVKSWAEGKIEPDASLLTALDLCLDCRACETACPIDVQYGTVLAGARDELAARAAAPTTSSPAERIRGAIFRGTLRHIVTRPERVRLAARFTNRVLRGRLGKWVQRRSERQPDSWLASAMTFAAALPEPKPRTKPTRELAPRPSTETGQVPVPPASPAAPTTCHDLASGQAAALFVGCAQEGMFPETNRATAALLEQAGFTVNSPAAQGCCGALHRHHGDKPFARQLVVRNLHAFGAFDETNDEPIVMSAGGCMAWIKEAAELFEPETEEHDAAVRMAARTRDISEVLSESDFGRPIPSELPASRPVSDHGASPGRVIYQPSCHLTHVCGVLAQPLDILQRITGGNASLPQDGGLCCGSAGIYNALQPEASRAILDRKMDGIADDAPDVIVTSNPGCHLQMLAGVRAHGLEDKVRVMQLADFVAEYGMNGNVVDR